MIIQDDDDWIIGESHKEWKERQEAIKSTEAEFKKQEKDWLEKNWEEFTVGDMWDIILKTKQKL